MIAPRTRHVLALFFFYFPVISYAQAPDPWIKQSHPPWYPKTYLRTDREVYFQGDSLWFKAFYLDGQNQMPVQGAFTLYAEMLDQEGRALASQVLLLDDGHSAGKMEIPATLAPGRYLLRACTDYQKSLGEDAFFHQALTVTSVESSMEKTEAGTPGQGAEIEVAFLPEGGYLLENVLNTVGVKALDPHGRGIPVEGEILNDKGNLLGKFSTMYQGMGAFQFIPRSGENYHVKVRDHPGFSYVFHEILDSGIKLEYQGDSGETIQFRVISNSETFQDRLYYFAVLNRGRIIFQQGFQHRSSEFPIKIRREALPAGINRLVLLDEHYRPLSERLYFSENLELNDIQIVTDRKQYGPRSEVQLELFDEEVIRDSSISFLSVAVVDAYAMPASGPEQTLLSWLLIDSELKGWIPSPAGFFEEDAQLSSRQKLDLLMLTHGWSRYLWTSFAGNDALSATELQEGFTLSGSLKHPVTRKPIARGEVELNLYNNGLILQDRVRTDKNGRFRFENIVFTDTASVFIQGRSKRGKLYTELDLDPLYPPVSAVTEAYLPVTQEASRYAAQLYEQKYYSDLDLKDFVLSNGSILLEEVSITRERVTGDGHYRVYPKPFNSLKITDKDYGYQNLNQYLQGRVAGLTVMGQTIMMRGPGGFGSRPPLFLVDGTPIHDQDLIMSIPMSQIDLVEVLMNPAELAIFGVNAGSGVISIFTKRGGVSYGDSFTPGTLAQRIVGYEAHKEFYEPRYSPENKDTARPDHRLTLYWNPLITTEQGSATASFYTSDDITRYRILVEGITNAGKVCLGSAEFEVGTAADGEGD